MQTNYISILPSWTSNLIGKWRLLLKIDKDKIEDIFINSKLSVIWVSKGEKWLVLCLNKVLWSRKFREDLLGVLELAFYSGTHMNLSANKCCCLGLSYKETYTQPSPQENKV